MQNALKLAYEHLASQKIFLGSLALAMIGSREGIAYPPTRNSWIRHCRYVNTHLRYNVPNNYEGAPAPIEYRYASEPS
jgi:hypothetical protein